MIEEQNTSGRAMEDGESFERVKKKDISLEQRDRHPRAFLRPHDMFSAF